VWLRREGFVLDDVLFACVPAAEEFLGGVFDDRSRELGLISLFAGYMMLWSGCIVAVESRG
jgi:hypothetical protein